MPYTLIKGTFHPEIGTPDGDSVRFKADDLKLIKRIPGTKLKKDKTVQLRYEGIDAIEKTAILPHSKNATNFNLATLNPNNPRKPSKGYILTKAADGQAGRPVCFVFTGNPSQGDGAEVFLTPDDLKKSVNYKIILNGFAYPLFYETLYAELRTVLVKALKDARAKKHGYINLDASKKEISVNNKSDLGTIAPIFPKLYRRLEAYLSKPRNLSGFLAWIEKNEKEGVHTLSDDRFIGFEDVLEVKGNTVKLIYAPEDMVFRPK